MKAFHISVWAWFDPVYRLELEVDSRAPLRHLDSFLRRIWLECCGHLSAFRIDEREFHSHPDPDMLDWGPPVSSMNVQIRRVVQPGQRFSYEYDFGSTTKLALRVVEERIAAFPGQAVSLIARNEPLQFDCVDCRKPGVSLCSSCSYDGEAWFCENCGLNHENEDEHFLLPVVNSPRMGVCGYAG